MNIILTSTIFSVSVPKTTRCPWNPVVEASDTRKRKRWVHLHDIIVTEVLRAYSCYVFLRHKTISVPFRGGGEERKERDQKATHKWDWFYDLVFMGHVAFNQLVCTRMYTLHRGHLQDTIYSACSIVQWIWNSKDIFVLSWFRFQKYCTSSCFPLMPSIYWLLWVHPCSIFEYF